MSQENRKENSEKKDKEEKKGQMKKGRLLKGVVVSDKMDKTAVVAVSRLKKHPKYKKRYVLIKKYKVHNEKKEYQTGDKVLIQECRPISKEKKWKILKKI